MKKILKWLNNNVLPLNYNYWKEGKDSIYNLISEKYKSNWLSCQNQINSYNLPLFIFLVSSIFVLLTKSDNNVGIIFLSVLIIWIILYIDRNNNLLDRYVDEKFLELSKKK